jgi:soluble lytic murein transglycosylase-like protein
MVSSGHRYDYGWRLAVLLVVLSLVPFGASSRADIYMYRDPNGVLHFTNAPTSPQYRIYIRSARPREDTSVATTRYDPIIRSASRHHGIDFFLLKAIIRAESSFNPRAVSRKGARGLMQIMPENFEMLQIKDPFDPRQNIMGGAYYFRRLLDRYEGKLALTLAAYNAGPTMVDRYQSIPPFPETQDYVEKVLRYYRSYKQNA